MLINKCQRQDSVKSTVQSYLQTSLERQLKLTAFDDDVGEIQQVNLNVSTKNKQLNIDNFRWVQCSTKQCTYVFCS